MFFYHADDVASFDPLNDISGLQFWLDPSDSSTTTTSSSEITAITDKTTNNYDGTNGEVPILGWRKVKNKTPIEYTGHGWMAFGADNTGVATELGKTDTFTFCLTFAADDTTTVQQLWSSSKGSADRFGITIQSGRIRAAIFNGSSWANVEALLGDTDMHTLVITGNSGTVTGYLDGVSMDVTPSANTLVWQGTTTLGSRGGNQNEFFGLIGEALVYDTVLSADDRATVESYLSGRWVGTETQIAKHAALRPNWPLRNTDSTNNTQNNRIKMKSAGEHDLVGIRLVYPNTNIDNGEKTSSQNAITVSCAHETLDNTITAATFAGSATKTISWGEYAITDLIPVTIPKNTYFYIRTHISWTGDLTSSEFANDATGDLLEVGTGLSDKSASGTITHGSDGDAYVPCMILSIGSNGEVIESYELTGDSNVWGSKDGTVTPTGVTGERGMESLFWTCGIPTSKSARNGATAAANTTGRTLRDSLLKYTSGLVAMFGTNDFRGGGAASTAITNMETIISNADTNFYALTIPPDESSGFGTGESSADADFDDERATFNAAIRAGLTGQNGYFDVGGLLETATDSNIWADTDNADADGYHISSVGYEYLERQLYSSINSTLGTGTVITGFNDSNLEGVLTWIDFSETGSLTLSGDTITTAADQSSNSNDVNGQNSPETGGVLNSLNAADLVSSDSDYFDWTGNTIRDALSVDEEFTVFISFKRDLGSTAYQFLLYSLISVSDRMAIAMSGTTVDNSIWVTHYNGGFISRSATMPDDGNPHLVTMRFSQQDAPVVDGWFDGDTMTATNTAVVSGGGTNLGGRTNGANTLDGNIGEFALVSNAMLRRDIYTLNDLLKTKWGV